MERVCALAALNHHQERHSDVKDHVCSECGKTFFTDSELKQHQTVHTTETPYKCSHCDKRFKRSTHLHIHERIHTGEKPYHCHSCGKRFTQLSSLICHKLHVCVSEIIVSSSSSDPVLPGMIDSR